MPQIAVRSNRKVAGLRDREIPGRGTRDD